MKKFVLILIIFIFLFRCVNAQWITQYYLHYIHFNSINFPNENTGYITGNGDGIFTSDCYFFRTTNGGLNWDSMPLPFFMSNCELYDQSFINVNTGYACGFTNKIFKTTNGGINWNYTLAPYSTTGNQSYSAIQFLNEQIGYIGGRYGFRAKTTNGGNNWITLDTAYAQITSVYFLDTNYGFMGDNWSDIYKTTDGGLTWSYKYIKDSLSNEYTFISIKFINYNTGYLLGANVYDGILFKTTNGGNKWKEIFINKGNPFYSLYILDGSIIYLGCSHNGLILKSTNGGVNWKSQYLPVQNPYVVTFFINSNIGYATSAEYIYKTTNGGVFVNNISSEIPNEYTLYQNYPNPFNPVTSIKYQVQGIKYIKLIVYDILGKEITVLINERQTPGMYEVKFDGNNFPSGTYFYKIQTGNFVQVKRMVLLK